MAGALTPVPRGVGPLTIAMLMNNTVVAAESRVAGSTLTPNLQPPNAQPCMTAGASLLGRWKAGLSPDDSGVVVDQRPAAADSSSSFSTTRSTWRFVSPKVPPVSITKSARCTLSSVGSCASIRASAWAAVRPSRSTTRATCWLRGQLVTITRSKSRSRPVSKSSGMSTTARLSPADGESIEPRGGRLADARMDDGLEIGAGLRVREHHDAEGPAIEAAVGQQDVRAEAFGHGRQAGRARGDGVARQHVGVEGRDAVRGQPGADVALAGRDAAGERRAQQGHADS